MNSINDSSMCSRKTNTTLARLALALLYAPLWACGGGSSPSPSSPTPVAVATPQPCAQTILFEGSGGLTSATVVSMPANVTSAGRLDIAADWTFASNPVGLYVVSGACGLEQFNTRSCTFLLRLEPGSKPLKGSTTVQVGSYSVLLANFGTREDSVALQIVQSAGSCPAVAGSSSGAATALPGNRSVERIKSFSP